MAHIGLFRGIRDSARRLRRHLKVSRDRARLLRDGRRERVRIVIGASGSAPEGWTSTDIEFLDLREARHWETYFERDSIDAMLAEHVWEHLTIREGLEAARRCFEYLRPGGYLRLAVPDGLHPNPSYRQSVMPGGSGPGAAEHKVLYDFRMLVALFEEAGFRVQLLEYFDTEGTFHFTDWDPAAGPIQRSKRFDERNRDGVLRYTSVILDAHKMG
jgi:predicted SAM-dependent methyltransferase